jgi:alanine or glycine:cation symporter, AGCS family
MPAGKEFYTMQWVTAFTNWLNGIVWGPVMIVLLVGTGLYLTLRLRFVQIRYLGTSIRNLAHAPEIEEGEEGDISHFQALAAALSATIGTGNIAGVATAIALGGPGAVFWMWVTALAGMATKFTSCSLAVKYRKIHPDGSASGGPMYFLSEGLGMRWLGVLFALFAGLASFGIGCAVQSNSVVDAIIGQLPAHMHGPRLTETVPVIGGTLLLKPLIGILLALLVGSVILGGIRRIAGVAAKIVPFMCACYIFGAAIILLRYAPELPGAFAQIIRYAFTPVAAGGGFMGFVLAQTVQKGVARGVFSNESGLGSAPIAWAAVRSNDPIRAGFVAMLGPLVDTIIVCTMTALVIVVTGAWQVKSADGEVLYGPGGKGVPVLADGVLVAGAPGEDGKAFTDAEGNYYPIPTGASLTLEAFNKGIAGFGGLIVSLGITLFAYSTMISWSYYGDRCWEYLLGEKVIKPYRIIFCIFVVIGTISGLDLVWTMADNLNALMAIPNLIGLIGLAGIVTAELRRWSAKNKPGATGEES